MKKRNLYTEIAEGFDAMSNARARASCARTRWSSSPRQAESSRAADPPGREIPDTVERLAAVDPPLIV